MSTKTATIVISCFQLPSTKRCASSRRSALTILMSEFVLVVLDLFIPMSSSRYVVSCNYRRMILTRCRSSGSITTRRCKHCMIFSSPCHHLALLSSSARRDRLIQSTIFSSIVVFLLPRFILIALRLSVRMPCKSDSSALTPVTNFS